MASSGVFSGVAPVTTWSSPGDTWSFSFDVNNTPTPIAGSVDTSGFDIPFTNFSYLLNSVSVPTAPVRIRFFCDFATCSGNGLLEVHFVNNAGPIDLSLDTGFALTNSNVQLFTGPNSSPTIQTGVNPATGAFFYSGGAAVDGFTGTVVSVSALAASVPEPTTLTMATLACCLFAWTRRRQKTR